jgi:hypothetical protein
MQMSNEEYNVAPIDHGVLSATGSIAAGTVGGGVKKGLLWGALWIGAATLGVAAIAAVTFGLGAAPLLIGGLLGGVMGTATSGFAGVIGSTIGAITGGTRAFNEVKQEKGAANLMQAQIDVMKAQNMQAASNDNKYSFPPQGSPMNMAGSTVNAMQADGRVSGQERQRA